MKAFADFTGVSTLVNLPYNSFLILMTTCKRCNVSGWFHPLTENSLCKSCNLIVVNRVQVQARTINRMLRRLRKANCPDQKLQLCRQLIQGARTLETYEAKDLPTTNPSPQTLIDTYNEFREQLHTPSHAAVGSNGGVAVKEVKAPSITAVQVAKEMDPLGTCTNPAVC